MNASLRRPFAGERTSILLLALNALGIAAYIYMASHGGWKILEEQAAGIDVTTSEPFIWAGGVFPIYLVFLLINLAWAIIILKRHRWSGGLLWLLNFSLWFFAVLIDFAHH